MQPLNEKVFRTPFQHFCVECTKLEKTFEIQDKHFIFHFNHENYIIIISLFPVDNLQSRIYTVKIAQYWLI